MKWDQAVRVLEECEQSLRKLVAEAAGEGDYGAVQRIAYLAKAVAALTAESGSTSTPSATAIPDSGHPASSSSKIGAKAGRELPGRRARTADVYPKFMRRGDELVKVGWSKKDRKEYVHRAPRAVITTVASALRQVGARGKRFNGDALLPLKESATVNAIPSYQVYVALAWLVRLGAVKQVGHRGGYILNESKPPEATFTAAWPELLEWQG